MQRQLVLESLFMRLALGLLICLVVASCQLAGSTPEPSEPKLGEAISLTPESGKFFNLFEYRCHIFRTGRLNLVFLTDANKQNHQKAYFDTLQVKFSEFADDPTISDQVYACPFDYSGPNRLEALSNMILTQGMQLDKHCGVRAEETISTPSLLIVDQRYGLSECYAPKQISSPASFDAIRKSFNIQQSIMDEIIEISEAVWPTLIDIFRRTKRNL